MPSNQAGHIQAEILQRLLAKINGAKRPHFKTVLGLFLVVLAILGAKYAPTAGATPGIPCKEAPSTIVSIINATFTGGEHLENTKSVIGLHDLVYVGGNIMAGAQRASSGDVWVVQHGGIYSLSSDARKRTLLPDGRDLASAGDQYGSAVIDCISGR